MGIGDYADCILKNDPRCNIDGFPDWVRKSNIVESQRKRVVELFKPLADEGKLLELGTGNHEEEIHMRHDNDIVRNICSDLKVPYGGYSCFLVLTFRRRKSGESHQYIWHSWHGSGAAQSEGAQVMRLMRLVNDIQAHIYTMGHLHTITTYMPTRLTYSNGRVKSTQLLAAITGSWLKAYKQPRNGQQLNPGYAEKKGYNPSRIGCPVIHIHPDRDLFSIEV